MAIPPPQGATVRSLVLQAQEGSGKVAGPWGGDLGGGQNPNAAAGVIARANCSASRLNATKSGMVSEKERLIMSGVHVEPRPARMMYHVGNRLFDVAALCGASLERGGKLYLYFDGGQYLHLSGDDAALVWELLTREGVVVRLPSREEVANDPNGAN